MSRWQAVIVDAHGAVTPMVGVTFPDDDDARTWVEVMNEDIGDGGARYDVRPISAGAGRYPRFSTAFAVGAVCGAWAGVAINAIVGDVTGASGYGGSIVAAVSLLLLFVVTRLRR